jgi:hypothetical protein
MHAEQKPKCTIRENNRKPTFAVVYGVRRVRPSSMSQKASVDTGRSQRAAAARPDVDAPGGQQYGDEPEKNKDEYDLAYSADARPWPCPRWPSYAPAAAHALSSVAAPSCARVHGVTRAKAATKCAS